MTTSEDSLFRDEALKALSERQYGRPIASVPKLWGLLSFFLIAIVCAGTIYIITSTYARKEEVVGWLEPDLGLVKLSAQQGA